MQPAPLMPKEDFDAPWKEVLDRQLSQLVAFFIPAAWEEIDWQRKPVSLNTELRRSRRDAASSDRRADSLFKVFLKDGGEHYVIIHVEVQSTVDPLLAQRMFEYGYRAWDRHKREVSSLVILGDTSPNFRPTGFGWSRWGSDMSYRFPVVKLIDYRDRWEELEASRNIFAVVVMAYLKTQDTRRDPEARLFWKSRLVRRLYERQYGRVEIVTLFALIDWMMQLPEDLAIIFEDDLESIEAEHRMPYVTSIERRALKKGRIQLLLAQLEHRFGKLPEWTRELLQKATPDLLDDWAVRMLDASRLEDVFA